MTTDIQDTSHSEVRTDTRATSRCERGSCRVGLCSPCILVWGAIAVWLIINAVWGALQ
jgi:hypothetical protein